MLIPKDEYKDTTVSVRTKMGNEKYHLGLISLTNQTIFKYLYDNGFAYIFDIDDELYEELFVFSKKIAKAIQKIVPCTKVGMSVIGLEVPHAHIHLVPINNISDLNFSGPRVSLKTSEFIELANQIQDVLN